MTGVPVWLFVFDVLEVKGEDVGSLPLLDRKRRLRKLLAWRDPIRWTPHRVRAEEEGRRAVRHQPHRPLAEGWDCGPTSDSRSGPHRMPKGHPYGASEAPRLGCTKKG